MKQNLCWNLHMQIRAMSVTDLVVAGRVLCRELQLLDDDIVWGNPCPVHLLQQLAQPGVIQTPRGLTNQSAEHVSVRRHAARLTRKIYTEFRITL